MALISRSQLRQARFAKAESFGSASRTLKSLASSPANTEYDVFLSHSFLDAEDVLALKALIETHEELSVYVDWINDGDLDRQAVNKATAARLRQRLKHCKSLLYATSENAKTSKWMPWECGYFDGHKGRIAICPVVIEPTMSSLGNEFSGQEYLSLYPYVARDKAKNDGMRLWVQDSPLEYVTLSAWVTGTNPTTHQS